MDRTYNVRLPLLKFWDYFLEIMLKFLPFFIVAREKKENMNVRQENLCL